MRRRLKGNLLVQNTIWTFLGQGLRVIIQAIYFVIIARSLGNQGYGAFVGVTAMVAILAPFAGLGGGHVLVKNVSRDRTIFRLCWGNALRVTLSTSLLLILFVLLITHYFLPHTIPFLLILSVALSDMLFARVLDVSGQAFQAFERMERTAQIQVLPMIGRLVAAILFITLDHSLSPVNWGWLYLGSTVVSTVIAIWIVCRELGLPEWEGGKWFSNLKEGFYFSISLSSQSIYNDIDKTMLARLSTLQATGIYGAAYRLIDVSFTPVRSLIYASYSKFFQYGTNGIGGSARLARQLLPISVGYGVVVGIALYLSAPILPIILGNDYQQAVEAIRWLALLPLLKSFSYFAGNTLTGAGLQGSRSIAQALVAVLNVPLCLLLIPSYSWQGAAVASLISDGVLAVSLWGIVGYFYKKTTATRHRSRYSTHLGG